MSECIFCKIVAGEIPAAKIYEDDKIVCFLDISPDAKGHALIIPKQHYDSMAQTPDDLTGHIFNSTKKIMAAIKTVTKAEVVVVKVVGTDVPHFHVHLIPSGQNADAAKYAEGEMVALADKIKQIL